MFVKDRRGGRNWAPGVFATFWILLAAFSAAYLFRIVSEPVPSQSAAAATPASDEETAALNPDGQTQELAALKASLRDLSQEVAELKARIKPLERLVRSRRHGDARRCRHHLAARRPSPCSRRKGRPTSSRRPRSPLPPSPRPRPLTSLPKKPRRRRRQQRLRKRSPSRRPRRRRNLQQDSPRSLIAGGQGGHSRSRQARGQSRA